MKKIIAILLCMTLFTTSAFAIKGEVINPEDLPMEMNHSLPSDWAGEEIAAAQRAGLIPEFTGTPKFTDAITREQFAELIIKAITVIYGEGPELTAPAFSDCDNPSVLLAASAGLVQGIGDGKFAPKQTTNREQIATMIARALDYLKTLTGKDVTPKPADISRFSDKAQVSSWATQGVGLLAANGLMKGTSDTALSPKASCTVEQSILLVYRLYEKFQASI